MGKYGGGGGYIILSYLAWQLALGKEGWYLQFWNDYMEKR